MLIHLNFILNIGILSKEILQKHKQRRNGKNFKPTRTALDDMLSLERIEKEQRTDINMTEDLTANKLPKSAATVSKDPYDYSSDSSGKGTHFAIRTGNFDLDFPESPKIPKMKANQSKKTVKNKPQVSTASDNDDNNSNTCGSDSDAVIQPSGVPIKQHKANEDSSDVVSLIGEDNIENVNFKRGQYGRKRGTLHFVYNVKVHNTWFTNLILLLYALIFTQISFSHLLHILWTS